MIASLRLVAREKTKVVPGDAWGYDYELDLLESQLSKSRIVENFVQMKLFGLIWIEKFLITILAQRMNYNWYAGLYQKFQEFR